MDLQNDALEFIVAYYSTLTCNQSDLPKFYDENALILRPTFQEPKLINQAHSHLAFLINKGTSINIISKSVIPTNDYLSITVIGSATINRRDNIFIQTFVLQEKYDRLYITSDSIQLVETFKPENNFVFNEKSYSEYNYINPNSDNDQKYSKKELNYMNNNVKGKISQEKISKKSSQPTASDQENEC